MQMHGRGTGCLGDRAGGRCCAPPQREQLRGQYCAGEKLAPADPEISLRIYYAQAGEELFAIAKHYHVSPGQMLAANDLAEGTTTIDKARRLLVPGA